MWHLEHDSRDSGSQVIARSAVTLTQGKYKRQNNTNTRCNNELHTLYNELGIDKVIKQEDWSVWDTSLEYKNWILAEGLLFLNQKEFDVRER
jgi:hypothetical protein